MGRIVIRLNGKTRIRRAAVDVTKFLADVANEPSWQKDVIHVQLIGGTAGEKGATYERVQVVGGRNIKTLNELATLEPGERVAFKSKGKVIEYTLNYTVVAAGKECDLEMKMEGEMLGFASMFEGMAADELKEQVPSNLERLKAKLEP